MLGTLTYQKHTFEDVLVPQQLLISCLPLAIVSEMAFSMFCRIFYWLVTDFFLVDCCCLQIHPDIFCRREILDLSVKCWNPVEGCEWKGQLKELEVSAGRGLCSAEEGFQFAGFCTLQGIVVLCLKE